MTVRKEQRHHSRRNPCPVCGGGDNDDRGKERRCHGWTSSDGWIHCSREEHAGSISAGDDGCYAHRPAGPCNCGQTHAAEVVDLPRERATYDYRDGKGLLRFQVVRDYPKKFWQRRPDGAGGWTPGRGDAPWLLYRLPELAKADPSKTVFIVEGEKDVESILTLGGVATCNPCGAGKWGHVAESAKTTMAGRDVVVVADNDEAGRRHAEDVRRALEGVCRSLQVMRAPDPHKDVTELVEAGGGLNELVALDAGEEPRPTRAQQLAPVLPFDEIWTAEPEVSLVIPALGICPGPAHLVAGSWYTGKTLFLMALGLAVASGRPALGVYGTRKGVWAHFDHEMGRRGVKRYVQRIAAGMGIGPEDVRDRIRMHVLPSLNLCSEGAADLYAELLEGVALCTIDPLRAAAPGQNENESEFRQWIDMLNSVSNRTGCAIVVLHHGGKPAEGRERRNTGRGTSAIDDAVQSKFVLTAEEKGAPVQISHEKTRELPEPLPDFWVQIVNEHGAVRLVHQDLEQVMGPGNDPLADIKRHVLKALGRKRGVKTGNELEALVTGRRQVIQQALRELIEDGRVLPPGGAVETFRVVPAPNSSRAAS